MGKTPYLNDGVERPVLAVASLSEDAVARVRAAARKHGAPLSPYVVLMLRTSGALDVGGQVASANPKALTDETLVRRIGRRVCIGSAAGSIELDVRNSSRLHAWLKDVTG